MKQSQAWMVQISSDLKAADAVYRENDPATYCQAVAKHQQVAEKCVKAMVAAVNDLGITFAQVGKSHHPTEQIRALSGLRRAVDEASVRQIERIFTQKRQDLIGEVCGFAPQYPSNGHSFDINTEYPYNAGQPSGEWTAPAEPGNFSVEQVKRYRELAWVLHKQVDRFVDSVRRSGR